MPRSLLATLVAISLGWSLPAQADDGDSSKPAKAAETAPKPAPLPSGVALLLPRIPAPTPAVQVDLFPPSIFGERGTFNPFGGGHDERRNGLSLGNDADWRVQAAQVGLMAGAFAALVGLCGGGKCMLPDAASSWLPDALKAKPQFVPDARPEPKVRQLR